MQRERQKMLNTQTNTTTSSWETTGFFPFNPHPEAWKNVLSTLGHLNSEIKKTQNGETEEEKEYEIQVKEGVKETIFTNEEKEALLEGMPSSASATEAAYYHIRSLLAKFRKNPPTEIQTNCDQNTVSGVSTNVAVQHRIVAAQPSVATAQSSVVAVQPNNVAA